MLAFVLVCLAVLVLRLRRPEFHRPFRCPLIYAVAPLGVLVNFSLTLFLPLETWLRLVIWLGVGLVIYFTYSRRHSLLTQHLMHEQFKCPATSRPVRRWTRKWWGSETSRWLPFFCKMRRLCVKYRLGRELPGGGKCCR